MNLRERIEELGYHVIGSSTEIHVYYHGDIITAFYCYDRRDTWGNIRGVAITLSNVEAKLKEAVERRAKR